MKDYELRGEVIRLINTITKAVNGAFPDDYAEAAKQKQYTVHRFCGLKVIVVKYFHDNPDYSSSVAILNGIDINASPVSKNEFLKYKNPIKNIMKFYKCDTIYIEFDLGKPSRVIFDINGSLLTPDKLGQKLTETVISPMKTDIYKLFISENQENMAEFLVDCLRLDPCVGPYMPYKEKVDE